MLVLSRAENESLVIEANGKTIFVTVMGKHRGETLVGIDAPKDVIINRMEVYLRQHAAKEGGK